tara:strand:+ start:678 stop:2072 length:1395 start_codon:yes stop_codon:yes gene_type:complete
MNKPVMLIQAPLATRSGYGSHSRDLIESLIDMDKFDIKISSLRWGDCPMNALDENNPIHKKMLDRILSPQNQLNQKPDINVEIRVPNEFQKVGKYNIGITAGMETTLISPEWIEGCNRMDLIIVPSKHSKKVFQQSKWDKLQDMPNGQKQKVGELRIEKPIEVLFEGADLNIYDKTKEIPETIKSTLDDIKENYCFLYVGHWLKGDLGQDRKDTGMLVKVFLETFKNKENPPALVMKTSGATFSIIDRDEVLQKIAMVKGQIENAEKLPPIYVLHGNLTDEEMNGLYNHPKVKANVSFTKGEGFGRPLLEATFADKPVITSNWSGHLDFLDSKLSVLLPGKLNNVHKSAVWDKVILKESQWFTIDYGYASKTLLDVWKNLKNYTKRALKQGSNNRLKFTLDLMKKEFTSMMDKYIPEFPKEVQLNLPKLKKVGDTPTPVTPVTLPKIKLPKAKKVESVSEGVSQ